MKLKNVATINKILNEFLEEFDAVCDMGPDFCYWTSDSTIHYSLVVSDRHNTHFMNNFHRLAPDVQCDVFLASFLHELGHHETLHLIDEADEAYCRDYKEMLHQRLDNEKPTAEVEADIYQQYFDLPDEYEATAWAIEYMRENADKVKELWEKVKVAIMDFYKANNVEVELA